VETKGSFSGFSTTKANILLITVNQKTDHGHAATPCFLVQSLLIAPDNKRHKADTKISYD
jgi:hypothetical protein